VDGLLKVLFGPLETEVSQWIAQDDIGIVEEGTGDGESFVDVAAHAHVLRALARKDPGFACGLAVLRN
jgi:hypothetical protein